MTWVIFGLVAVIMILVAILARGKRGKCLVEPSEAYIREKALAEHSSVDANKSRLEELIRERED